MYKKTFPNQVNCISQFPHCDSKVLHAPGECQYCDKHPEWQQLRQVWGVAFTGYDYENDELPDPATYARGLDVVNHWPGNVAKK